MPPEETLSKPCLADSGYSWVSLISQQQVHGLDLDFLHQTTPVLGWKREGALGNLLSAFVGESVFLEAAVGFFGDSSFGTGRKYARP